MILLYKGVSRFSRVIRFFNWSEYSHAAWMDDDGSVWQAWKSGVTHDPAISYGHRPGTQVEIYRVTGETPEIRAAVREFLSQNKGKKYDYLGILGFVFRAERLARKQRWFCSELVAEAYAYAAHPLLRIPSNQVYPGMLGASPLLKLEEELVTL